ncbi:uncharacterized protein LOC129941736 [Eupeodes corollae]|uniref:uncharacterized protein LOC129941736 n=1 Tax=Eupeodes corollae TaxID=290404 RepID=UPI002492E8BB|nr:uncharacterized protein LOC129941736 [Eupeodes corollae]
MCSEPNVSNLMENEIEGVDSPISSDKNSTDVQIDVEQILKASFQGKSILNLYKSSQNLNVGSRTIIIDLIIKYMLQEEIRMTVGIAKQIADKIGNLFKTEYLGYYYTKQSGKKPQGKIYDKYYNSTRLLKKSGILQKRSYSALSPGAQHKRVFNLDEPESDVSEHIEEIIRDNCTWAEMERHWDASKNFRLFEITKAESTVDILAKCKQYKNPIGFKLINMDFKPLYPKAESLLLKYDDFSVKIIPIFEDEIKDPTSRQTLSEMMNNEKIYSKMDVPLAFFI